MLFQYTSFLGRDTQQRLCSSVAPSVGIIALYLMNTESNVKSPCYLPAEVSLKLLQNKSRIILPSLENSQFIKLLLRSFLLLLE